jgi:hypothetical protein
LNGAIPGENFRIFESSDRRAIEEIEEYDTICRLFFESSEPDCPTRREPRTKLTLLPSLWALDDAPAAKAEQPRSLLLMLRWSSELPRLSRDQILFAALGLSGGIAAALLNRPVGAAGEPEKRDQQNNAANFSYHFISSCLKNESIRPAAFRSRFLFFFRNSLCFCSDLDSGSWVDDAVLEQPQCQ